MAVKRIGAGKAQPVEMRNFGQFHRKAHACLTSLYDSISHIAQSSQRPRGGGSLRQKVRPRGSIDARPHSASIA
jgi:hypothetical protein